MFSRITLALILIVAVLIAPAAPIDLSRFVSAKAGCSARMDTDPCQRCPVRSNQTNSNSACCSVQAPCFVGYANAYDDFIAATRSGEIARVLNDRITSRSQRPPVPPPRIAFS
jgi:hypothetical protein